MNWMAIGGAALIVIWLAGRRVAKRDGQSSEPIFGTGEGSTGGAGGAGYYGGFGGGDGLASGPIIAPKSESESAPFGTRSLMEGFVNDIGFGSLKVSDQNVELPDRELKTVVPMDAIPLTGNAFPKSAQVAANTSSSTAMGSSALPMSAMPSTANNASAVSSAVQAQPPRSFSSVSAAISEKSMLPVMISSSSMAKLNVAQSIPAPTVQARPSPVAESFVASIRPVASRPAILSTSLVRR